MPSSQPPAPEPQPEPSGTTSRPDGPDRRTLLSTRRLEAYTDGVFAIAATLLVLNLSVDRIGVVHSNADLSLAVLGLAPSLLNVVISFLLLSLLWLVHLRQFEFIPQVDTTIVWLNNLRLLGVVLVPFTTSLTDEYGEFLIGRTLLPFNFFVILLFSTWQWFHASSARHYLVQGVSAAAVHNGRVNSASALAQAVLVVVVATMVGSAAFLIFALDPLVARVLRRSGMIRPTPDGVVVG